MSVIKIDDYDVYKGVMGDNSDEEIEEFADLIDSNKEKYDLYTDHINHMTDRNGGDLTHLFYNIIDKEATDLIDKIDAASWNGELTEYEIEILGFILVEAASIAEKCQNEY